MPPKDNYKLKKGFTVLELLIVIAIIGIFAGVVMVRMSKPTDKAKIASSQVFSDSIRHSLMANRVAEWKFDEAAGTLASDTMAAGNGDMINFNAGNNFGWRSGAECVFGSCLKFDGANDYINVSADLGDPSEMTIDLWFKKANINAGSQYLMDARNGGNWYLLQDYRSGAGCPDQNGNVCFNGRVEIGSQYLANDTWENVVVVQNPSFTKIYLNGELKKTGTGADPDIGQDLRIGRRYNSGNSFNGFMDEVRIYNKAMSISSIQKNYAIGLEGLFASGQMNKDEYQKRLVGLERAGNFACQR
ncbi:MAG: LamG-like jellyroll fold domain-containing protein [Candidatus Paceibacterota bacterium]|jgi:prepilin-type N-terminal cleavage/methylation domain-containing protein